MTSTTNTAMTAESIKAAVNAGKTVHWSNTNYVVERGAGECSDEYFIRYIPNDSVVGLTWRDGVTLNGNASDFFVADAEFEAALKKGDGNMRAIIKAAVNIDELYATLEGISADDGKEIEDYTDAEIVHEAEYVLSTFHEGGHINGDALSGDLEDGPYDQKWARGEVRKLKALIKKYS